LGGSKAEMAQATSPWWRIFGNLAVTVRLTGNSGGGFFFRAHFGR
jgi:hypothetical protein